MMSSSPPIKKRGGREEPVEANNQVHTRSDRKANGVPENKEKSAN